MQTFIGGNRYSVVIASIGCAVIKITNYSVRFSKTKNIASDRSK